MCTQHTEQHKDIRKPSLVQLLYGRRTVRSHNDVYYHAEQSRNAVLLEVQHEILLRSSSGSFMQELKYSHHREGGPLATHAGSLTKPETARPKCSKRLPLAPLMRKQVGQNLSIDSSCLPSASSSFKSGQVSPQLRILCSASVLVSASYILVIPILGTEFKNMRWADDFVLFYILLCEGAKAGKHRLILTVAIKDRFRNSPT